jgi:hypothetical protein
MNSGGRTPFRLLTPEDLEQLPEPCWLIEGILPEDALAVLYGKPETYKSFVALSMALSIAAGHDWCGRSTTAGAVLYIAAEGLHGFKIRVPAYLKKHEINAEHIRFLGDEGINLTRPEDIERLISSLAAAQFTPKLIVLDTLARLIPGADENSAQDMGAAIAAIDRLKRHFSATVLLVHHTGKGGKIERGSSALRGAADVMIKCERQGRSVSLECEKMKDAEPFAAMAIQMELIQVGASASSLAVKSCFAGRASGSVRDNGALGVLETQFGSTGATHNEWLNACMRQRAVQSKSTFERAREELVGRGVVRKDDGRYYVNRDNGGVRCHEVSTGCHDTSRDGVMSSPPLGDDTDTAAPDHV